MSGSEPPGSRSILVIDDDDDFRASCVDVLTLSGYLVEACTSGRDGLAYLREAARPPELILLDLMMEDVDGWSFRTRQQRDPLLADIPVLVISAGGGGRPDGIEASNYLSKLVDPEVLLQTVARLARVVAR